MKYKRNNFVFGRPRRNTVGLYKPIKSPKIYRGSDNFGNDLTRQSLSFARAGLALGFLGLTLGVATKAFKNSSQ